MAGWPSWSVPFPMPRLGRPTTLVSISYFAILLLLSSETRLANLLRLNQNAVEGQPKIDATEHAARQLDDATIHTDVHERLQAEHDDQLIQLRRRYSTLSERLKVMKSLFELFKFFRMEWKQPELK